MISYLLVIKYYFSAIFSNTVVIHINLIHKEHNSGQYSAIVIDLPLKSFNTKIIITVCYDFAFDFNFASSNDKELPVNRNVYFLCDLFHHIVQLSTQRLACVENFVIMHNIIICTFAAM